MRISLTGEDGFEVFDLLDEVAVFVFDFLAFQSGEALQAHFQNGLRLNFGQLEARHQILFGFRNGLGGANRRDDRVDMVERDAQTFEDVRAFFGFLEVELGASIRRLRGGA